MEEHTAWIKCIVLKGSYGTIEKNAIIVFEYIYKCEVEDSDRTILEVYYQEGIQGNLDKAVNADLSSKC